jgi:hypothetical protein
MLARIVCPTNLFNTASDESGSERRKMIISLWESVDSSLSSVTSCSNVIMIGVGKGKVVTVFR